MIKYKDINFKGGKTMKKSLVLGALALSTASMAAAPNLSAPAVEGTVIFNQNVPGSIQIKGTLTSEVPEVKYVIYASTDKDGIGNNKSDVLELPKFILSTKESSAGFGGATIPKVYVKRINGDATDVTDLSEQDKPAFQVVYNSEFDRSSDFVEKGEVAVASAMSLGSRAAIDKLLVNAGDFKLNQYGNIRKQVYGSVFYQQAKDIAYTAIEKGVLEVKDKVSNIKEITTPLTSEENAAVERALAQEITLTGAKINIKML